MLAKDESLIMRLVESGYNVTPDEDGDPCFHVSRSEFEAHRDYEDTWFLDILKENGYSGTYSVVASS